MKRKFNYLWLSFLIVFLTIEAINGQKIKNNEVLYKLPEDYCLAVKVIQNRFPIQFENIDILVKKNGKAPFINWGLKNNSSKSIRRFVVAFKIKTNIDQWRGFAGGQIEYDIGTDEKNDLILPNSTYQEVDFVKNSSLPQEINNLFSRKDESDNKKFIIVYGMINKVVFNDGSVYEEDNEVFKEF
jgi:hypothetical protein